MNKFSLFVFSGLLAIGGLAAAHAEDLVILHTNDTHSLIDPDENGRGGVLQRKAIIDSVRRAEKNVILVDAGDAVQGSLYFKFFKGDVEYPLMQKMGYDIRVLGNHEFDNGVASLAKYYKDLKGKAISANYDFKGTELDGIFSPYIIKKVAGKKIGFFGLNVDPASLISKENIEGIKFSNIVETGNRTADYLKNNKKCDLVVAVTHIGYNTKQEGKETDVDLARKSRNIDIIIGGHSHTLVTPGTGGKYPSIVENAAGRPVLIAQTGKYGKYLGYIKIDLDSLKNFNGTKADYELIPVTDRFSGKDLDQSIVNFLKPYRHVVDSVNNNVIGYAPRLLRSDDTNGEYANWAADFVLQATREAMDSIAAATGKAMPRVDMGLMNIGGIRMNMPAGDVTEGRILSTFPFANKLVVTRLKGSDLIKAMEAAARRHGEAVSNNVRVVVNPDWTVYNVVIDGRKVDPDKYYNVGTINYLAEGNDDLKSLANGDVLWTDSRDVSIPILNYVRANTALGLPMADDPDGRFVRKVDVGSQDK